MRDTSELLASDGWHEGKFALEIQVYYVPPKKVLDALASWCPRFVHL